MADMVYPPPFGEREALWRKQYTPPITMASPAYPRTWGRLLSGLMMAEPPKFADPDDGFVMSGDDLADLTETMVAEAAGLGVAYARPVRIDDAWSYEPVPPKLCRGRFAHRTLAEFTSWDWRDHPTDDNLSLFILERWDGRDWSVALYEVPKIMSGRVTISDELQPIAYASRDDRRLLPDTHSLVNDPWHQVVRDYDVQTERPVIAYVWAWEGGMPAPVHVGHEAAVTGLMALWDQEQDDAEMVRRRIAMPKDLAMRSDYTDSTGAVISHAGWNKSDHLLLLEQNAGSVPSGNGITQGQIETIEFSDDITMRDRIERRENGLLEACGISPQSFGRSVSGTSDSGAAKRADNQTTLTTITGPSRRWARTLRSIVSSVATLNRSNDPGVVIVEGFRTDITERMMQAESGLAAEAMSARERVRHIHPDWSDEQVDAEVAALAEQAVIVLADE